MRFDRQTITILHWYRWRNRSKV